MSALVMATLLFIAYAIAHLSAGMVKEASDRSPSPHESVCLTVLAAFLYAGATVLFVGAVGWFVAFIWPIWSGL